MANLTEAEATAINEMCPQAAKETLGTHVYNLQQVVPNPTAYNGTLKAAFCEGRRAVNYVYASGPIDQDGCYLTITHDTIGAAVAEVYEFDPGDDGVAGGNIEVANHADNTADATMVLLVAAINASSAYFSAKVWTANDDTSAGCTIYEKVIGSGMYHGLAKAGTAEAHLIVGAAAFETNLSAYAPCLLFHSYTVTAQDVTTLALGGADEVPIGMIGLGPPSTWVIAGVWVRASTGAYKAPTGLIIREAVGSVGIVVVEDGAATLATDDTIDYLILAN